MQTNAIQQLVNKFNGQKFQFPTFKLWPPSSPLHYTKEISENTKENVKGQNFEILSR